jgi:hypothetical protein
MSESNKTSAVTLSNDDPPSTNYTTTNPNDTGEATTTADATTTEADPDDDMDPQEEARIKHWQESPFAVGLVKITWKDEQIPLDRRQTSSTTRDYFNKTNNGNLICSAYCCACLGADRVGNMAVLAQTTEEYDHVTVHEETGVQTTRRKKRPKLLWVLGPYWPVNLCITFPLILAISFWTGMKLQDDSIVVIILWLLCTVTMLVALAMIACRDPGILYRHTSPPPGTDSWRWNDQSKTFRPPKARYDPECGVVIEGFDHT